jgi:hypothetical protein
MCKKNLDQYEVLGFFYSEAQKSVLGQQLPQILPSSYLRLFLAQKRNKKDKERLLPRLNFQDSKIQ